MAFNEVSKVIECIDEIFATDNQDLINALDKYLNARGVSVNEVCDLISKIPDAAKVSEFKGDVSDSLSSVANGDIASSGAGLVQSVIDSARSAISEKISALKDMQSLASSYSDTISNLSNSNTGVPGAVTQGLQKFGVSNIDAGSLISDVQKSIDAVKIGDLAKQAKDGIKENFSQLSDMASSILSTSGGTGIDFSKVSKMSEKSADAGVINKTDFIAKKIALALCETYTFMSQIDKTAADLNAFLANQLRALNFNVSFNKNGCLALIEDSIVNGNVPDICEMNSYYANRITLLNKPFGNKILRKLSGEIDKIVKVIKDARSEIDEAWNDLVGEISPCVKRSNYSREKLNKFKTANAKFNKHYKEAAAKHNYIVNEIKAGRLDVSDSELDYINSLFKLIRPLFKEYLLIINDMLLAEDIKRYDFISKSDVLYRNEIFDVKSGLLIEPDNIARVTGIAFINPLNVNTIKCDQF